MSTPSGGNTPAPKQLPDGVVEQFVKTQYQKALNESEEIKLKAKDIDHQADYAKKLLEHQAKFIANQPAEHRKTITRYGYIGLAFLVVFLLFVGGCLYLNKDEFVKYFLQVVSYIVVSSLSFYFGKKSGDKKSDDKIQEAEVVE